MSGCNNRQGNTRRLKELIDGLPIADIAGEIDGVQIAHITDDSRQVRDQSLFIARPGNASDGRAFIGQAVAGGAVAILTDAEAAATPSAIPTIRTSELAFVAATVAERFHGEPSRSVKLIGVTGTNGKTTVAHLVRQIAAHAGIRCGLIGTVFIDNGKTERRSSLTTPGSIELSAILAEMCQNGCEWCVMEVSSHALMQGRTAALAFDVGIFTNLSGDHLDYHSTMEQYAAAKAKLFESLAPSATAIVNGDDPSHRRMIENTRATVLRCSTTGDGDAAARMLEVSAAGSLLHLALGGEQTSVKLPLIGAHNAANALHAAAACHALGINVDQIREALAGAKAPPGRYEPANDQRRGPVVLIDYAHTDHALHNALAGLRPVTPKQGRLRVVFGCGGDRDRSKRPRMGHIACSMADDVIITSDNPRTEDPRAIIAEIAAGISKEDHCRVEMIVDRAEAIHHAIKKSGSDDILLIAGKGHEDYQIIGSDRRDFDDRKVAAEAIALFHETELATA